MLHEIKMKVRKIAESNNWFRKIYICSSNLKIIAMKNLSDEQYLKLRFKEDMGRELNLENPRTFNEKLQWLKLNDRNPNYTNLVDKYEVRSFIEDRIGKEYLIPLLGVWKSFDDIDFNSLPNSFVLKCTHDSQSTVICKDKSNFDIKEAKKILSAALKRNYFYNGREWPYKNNDPKIIAEKYMINDSNGSLIDYKFFCFNGEPKIMFIASERNVPGAETKFDFFDMDFNHLELRNGHPNSRVLPKKPTMFNKMKIVARILSKDIPHVRVDLYELNGEIYFGEMTFYHFGGMVPFDPEEWDTKLGSWIDINRLNKKHND